jgi:hypothetical protein
MDAVPETFVDAFGEISLKHGMIRIELVSLSGAEPRVTHRLITSLQAFSQMLQAQKGMFEQLEKAGVIRPTAPQLGPHPDPAPQAEEATGSDEAAAGTAGSGVAAAVRRLVRMEPVPRPAPIAAAPDKPEASANLGPPRSPNFSDEQ